MEIVSLSFAETTHHQHHNSLSYLLYSQWLLNDDYLLMSIKIKSSLICLKTANVINV